MAWRGVQRWSIGPISGYYQPEEFKEEQNLRIKEHPVFNSVTYVQFLGYEPRRITLSFIVNALVHDLMPPGNQQVASDAHLVDPEQVWATILFLMGRITASGRVARPRNVKVSLPGWGEGRGGPQQAIIERAAITRTHIGGGTGRAMRALITLTLTEVLTQVQAEQQGIVLHDAKGAKSFENTLEARLRGTAAEEEDFFS